MTARVPEPCDVPGEHEGPVRFFVTGWKCRAHAPQPPTTNRNGGALPGTPAPTTESSNS